MDEITPSTGWGVGSIAVRHGDRPVTPHRTCSLVVALTFALGCKRNEAPPAPESPPSTAPSTPPAVVDPAKNVPVPVPSQPTAPTSPQPRVERTAPEYNLVASLTNGTFDLAIRGAGEYHVNENYPIAVTLQVENGSVDKSTLRRPDATEFGPTLARFTQPVRSTGAGTVLRGNVRFGMCRAEQCGFFHQEFALAAQ